MRVILEESIFPIGSAPTPQCHASTIVETASGLLCAWFGGTREGAPDVGIWLAANPGDGWSPPRRVCEPIDDEPCWNPVLNRDPAGGISLFYKSGPSPSTWQGRVIVSRDDGRTWAADAALAPGFIGPVKNKSLRLADGAWLHPSSTEHDGWKCHFEIGSRLIEVADPHGLQAIQPTLLTVEGRYVALTRTRAGVIGRTESDDGYAWTPLTGTNLVNPNSGIDATTLADGRHALAYNPVLKQRHPLTVALSDDSSSWTSSIDLTEGAGEFSYPAVIQTADGLLHVTYTDRRRGISHAVIEV